MYEELKKHTFVVIAREHYIPLGIIRSLGVAGFRPDAIIIKGRKRFVGSCKYISKAVNVENVEEAFDVLKKEYIGVEMKPFVYITDDYCLEYFDGRYDEIKDFCYITNAGEQGKIQYYMQKANQNLLAEKCGIKVPKGERMLLQEFIDRKSEFNIDGLSVNHGKSVFLSMTTEYVYLLRGRDSGYIDVTNVTDLELAAKLKKMISEMGYEGIFSGEFMRGKDGDVYFLEVNPRPNAFNYTSTCAGMNDPVIWAQGMLDGYVDEAKCYKEIPNGFRAMW